MILPGRANSGYGGDHFVVVTGMIGDRFIINDPVDSDGRGYARLISADALERGMALASVPKVAFAAAGSTSTPALSPSLALAP